MAKTKWDELLAASTTPSSSRADVVQQMLQVTSTGGSGSASSVAVAGTGGSSTDQTQEFTEQISSLATQITNLASVEQTQVSAMQDNTQALTQNTASKSGVGSSVGDTAGGIASTLLGGGSILSPIVSGLLSAFGSTSPVVAPTGFTLPGPVQYESGITGTSQVSPVTFGQGGQPRAQAPAAAPQINIQVSAMDSQSFLDRSDDIAAAVKTALLNSHSLSDVISDL